MEKEYTPTQYDNGMNAILEIIGNGAINGESLDNIMRELKVGVAEGLFVSWTLPYLISEGLILEHDKRFMLTHKGLDYIRKGGYVKYKRYEHEKAYNDLRTARFAARTQLAVFIIAILALTVSCVDLLTRNKGENKIGKDYIPCHYSNNY